MREAASHIRAASAGRPLRAGDPSVAQLDDATEDTYALEFEEPAFITLGLCYEERPRFSGGAYNPVFKRVDQFLKQPLKAALKIRVTRAKALMALDEQEALPALGGTGRGQWDGGCRRPRSSSHEVCCDLAARLGGVPAHRR